MSSVKDTIDSLRVEFKMWQGLLMNCRENPADCTHIDDHWTLKDVLAHLTSWQEVTLARLVAARINANPDYPDWFPGSDPETDADLNRINAAIYQAHSTQTLGEIKEDWENRFSEILVICQLLSEQEFLEPNKYAFIGGYPLLAVLEGTLAHHREHRDSITGKINSVK